jgi:hypothetical protein
MQRSRRELSGNAARTLTGAEPGAEEGDRLIGFRLRVNFDFFDLPESNFRSVGYYRRL